jgi:hypothetical protein
VDPIIWVTYRRPWNASTFESRPADAVHLDRDAAGAVIMIDRSERLDAPLFGMTGERFHELAAPAVL